MPKRYSIAEARHNLAAIVHELEAQPAIELTRRGIPVAVLISVDTFRQLQGDAPSFWDAYIAFRSTFDIEEVDWELDDFANVRDASPGRDVHL